MMYLQPNMTKQDVFKILGQPYRTGMTKLPNGSFDEVLVYKDLESYDAWNGVSSYREYHLHFLDNQLTQWGAAGDWKDDEAVNVKIQNQT